MNIGMVIGIKSELIAEYKRLHAVVWPAVLARLKASNTSNYSIFLREPENLMFGYWENTGADFEADMQKIAANPNTQDWWKICGPMQAVLDSRAEGEWWATIEEFFIKINAALVLSKRSNIISDQNPILLKHVQTPANC